MPVSESTCDLRKLYRDVKSERVHRACLEVSLGLITQAQRASRIDALDRTNGIQSVASNERRYIIKKVTFEYVPRTDVCAADDSAVRVHAFAVT